MAKLYVVATPIGNLGDWSPRAADTLREANLIAAEDTRVTGKLCQVFGIRTPMISCHRHNEDSRGEQLAERMAAEDLTVALTTDAGTPCVSDPGDGLVRACLDRGIPVEPVPGCCAAVAALSISGFDTREFTFYGFLPREKKDLREKLREILLQSRVAVIHESPFRVKDLVSVIGEEMPGARLSLSCDLTKMHELTLRGRPEQVLDALEANPKAEKGEYCLVLDLTEAERPEPEEKASAGPLEARLVAEMVENGLSLRDAQNELVLSGEKKNAVKQAALALKKLFAEGEGAG
ncbi:MAG: 16S rRNA (cytidine(1402)-2'-O)-methyltransferase [Clostridia bacterium]|nr:16S rRNA (cytidine(1402)-2'-O)-methyltransferase [Clostridia bacterium]